MTNSKGKSEKALQKYLSRILKHKYKFQVEEMEGILGKGNSIKIQRSKTNVFRKFQVVCFAGTKSEEDSAYKKP